MTHIALFLPSLHGGGAERVMVTLANAFAARGYCVDLVLGTAQGPYMKDVSPRLRVVDLKAGRMLRSLLPLARYLRREQPVTMLSAINHANLIAIFARMLAGGGTRVVVSEHNTIRAEASRAQGITARAVYALIPRLYRRASGIIAVSRDAADDLARFAGLPAGSVCTIYNPFDTVGIEQEAAAPAVHPWFAPEQPPVVIAIGRLTEQKDLSTLIRAFALVRVRRAARLLILGEGELRGALTSLIAECNLTENDVQMPGFVSNPFAYLGRSGVFVLSSQWEGFGNVIVEAMACGTPVVSADCPSGPREILEGGRWGRLVPVGEIEMLAHAIDAVLATPRDQLPNVRARAKDFDQEIAADAYLEALGMPPAASQTPLHTQPRNDQ